MAARTTTTLVAYHGDADLKDRFLAELRAHQDADAIVQGTFGEMRNGQFRGCAVGCSIHSMANIGGRDLDTADYSLYASQLGIPEWLARIEETIFERLSVEAGNLWPVCFAEAIPVGVDLEPIRHEFLEWLMDCLLEMVQDLDMDDEVLRLQVLDALFAVRDLHTDQVSADDLRWMTAREDAQTAYDAVWEVIYHQSPTIPSLWVAARAAGAAMSAAEQSVQAPALAVWKTCGSLDVGLIVSELVAILGEAGLEN